MLSGRKESSLSLLSLPASQDVGPRTKEPLSFSATPPIVTLTRGFLVSQPQAGILVTKWWKVWGRMGEGESQDLRRYPHPFQIPPPFRASGTPQASPPSGLHQQWGEKAEGLICI